MLVLGDFTDMALFMHHAPYQAGTGEYGNHDLRNLFASVTKYIDGLRGTRVELLAEPARALDGVRDAREPVVLDVVTTEHAPFWQVQSALAKEGPGRE